tara:strand:- start:48 stop:1715 length:1668 start_codon:yes stop_codon:yes gene_type:complete
MALNGGASGILVDIIQALLEMKTIKFLPKTTLVNDETKYNDYFASVDSKTLLYLVKEYDVDNIDAIQKIFGGPIRDSPPQINNQGDKLLQNLDMIKPDLNNMKDMQYYQKFLSLNSELENLESNIKNLKGEIDKANLQLQNFQCIEGLDNEQNGFLSNFILDCSKYSNRDIDWYRVILKLDNLDDEYEIEVNKLTNKNGLQLNYESIKDVCNTLSENTTLKDIFKDKLIECSKAPYSFLDTLTGNISFDSLNDCQKCHDDCILYLNDSYKSFLMDDSDGIGVSNKLKVLLFCEFRLYAISKHITLEALRIKKQNYTRVKNILKKLSVEQKKKIVQKNVVDKQRAEDILKLKKLEAQQKTQKTDLDKLVNEKQKSLKGGSHHRGGADINDNLMKQNLLSQVLQIIASDKSLVQQGVNVGDVQDKLNNIGNKPMGMPPGMDKPPGMAEGIDKPPGMGMVQDIDKPQGMDNKPMGMDKPQGIDNKPMGMPDKPLGMDKPPMDMRDKPNNDDIMIKDELIPNCTAIAQDIMDGKINEKNFIYLSPKCDTQIMNALKSSR